MTRTGTLLMAAALTLALLPSTIFADATIDYSSPYEELGQTASGAPMTQATFTFALGVFTGFTPTAGNVPQWVDNFTSLETSPWYDDPGNGIGEISSSYILPVNSTARGLQAYLWGYNNSSRGSATQWILLTNPNWIVPSSTAGNPTFVEWSTTDPGTVAVTGYLSGTTSGGASAYLKSAGVTESLPPTSPTVITGTASGTVYNSTTLNGAITPNGLPTSYYFQYGPTAAYGISGSDYTTGTGSAIASTPNLVFWYDASDLSGTSGTLVNSWPDRSGNNWNLSGNGTYSFDTLSGRPAVQFTSGNGYTMSSATTALSGTYPGFTLFWEEQFPSLLVDYTNYSLQVGSYPSNYIFAGMASGTTPCTVGNASPQITVSDVPASGGVNGFAAYCTKIKIAPNRATLYCYCIAGGTATLWMDGVCVGVNAGGFPPSSPLVLNGAVSLGAMNIMGAFTVNMASVVGFSRGLNMSEVQAINAELEARYHLHDRPRVLFIGDSISEGDLATAGTLEEMLAPYFPTLRIENASEGGQSAFVFATESLPWGKMFNSIRKGDVCLLWNGSIDTGNNTPTSTVESYLETEIAAVHAQGGKAVLVTQIPRNDAYSNGSTSYQAATNILRAQFNAWVNSGTTGADGVIDPTTIPAFSATTSNLNSTFYADASLYTLGGIHPSTAGYALMVPLFVNQSQIQTAAYGYTTPTQVSGSGVTGFPVDATIMGLDAATTYHYRLVAANSSGMTYGSDQTFTTPNAPPPAVITGTAAGTTYHDAILSGTVNPNGLATSVYFEYGTTTAYGDTTGTLASGSSTSAVSCSVPIGGLISGTTYHYRLVDVNSSGTTYGNDQTFIRSTNSNADLSALQLRAGALSPGFVASGTGYTVNVVNNVATTTVTAVSAANATMQISLNNGTLSVLKSGKTSGPLKLQVGVNTINIVVTAPDLTKEIYSIAINRAALPGGVAAMQSGTAGGMANTKFISFGSPAINDLGDVAFQAVVSGTGARSTSFSAIFVESGSTGAMNEVASTSGTLAAAPGVSGAGQIGSFATLGDPVFNNAGEIAFLGTVKSAGTLKVTSANDQGIWANASGTLHLIAREGQTLLSGAKFASFSQLALPDHGGPVFLATLALQPGKVTAKNNQGIWGTGSNGALELLVSTGQPLVGGTSVIMSLSIFGSPARVAGQTRSFNAGGELMFAATFTDKSQGIYTLASDGTVSPVSWSHDDAPIASGSATFISFNSPVINDAGNAAFQATIAGSGVMVGNNVGIWAESGTAGPLALVARLGVPAFYLRETGTVSASMTGTFTALSEPVFNANDQVAFIGTVKTGTGKNVAIHQGIWMTAITGELVQVIQAQDPAPGCTSGAKFSAFTQLALPNQAGAIFVANLATGVGGVTAATNQGIWEVDPAGILTLVACKGDVLDNGKTIASFSVFGTSTGIAGQTRSFNSAGDLVYKVTFTDGTQGIYKVVFPQAIGGNDLTRSTKGSIATFGAATTPTCITVGTDTALFQLSTTADGGCGDPSISAEVEYGLITACGSKTGLGCGFIGFRPVDVLLCFP